LARRRVCQRRYYTAVLDGNLHVRTGDSHANADRDSNGNSHADSDTNCDSDSYAYADSDANCDSDSYAYTDSDANCDSDSYAYTDGYANCDGDSYCYRYTDTYFHTETNPDAKRFAFAQATSDTAASPIGPDSEACLAVVRRLPDEGG
jgi:hypothetical protein